MFSCTKCKAKMSGLNATGLCRNCRMVKCEHPSCEKMIAKKANLDTKTFCKQHNGQRKGKVKGMFDGLSV